MNWLPPDGALHGHIFDHLLRLNLGIVFGLFVGSQVLMLAALLIRGGKKAVAPGGARPRATGVLMGLLPLAAFAGLYLWMDMSSHHIWAARRETPPRPDALRVEVTGVQFQWYFRYPGTDGVFGRLRPSLVNAPNGNPLGLDPSDPQGRDDIVSSILELPAGRQVMLSIRSQDVIHGFFVPGMRLKQDAVPGASAHILFTPAVPGTYPILCSQVCGLGHGRMQARMKVVPEAAFRKWLAGRERATLAAGPPAAASNAGGQP